MRDFAAQDSRFSGMEIQRGRPKAQNEMQGQSQQRDSKGGRGALQLPPSLCLVWFHWLWLWISFWAFMSTLVDFPPV